MCNAACHWRAFCRKELVIFSFKDRVFISFILSRWSALRSLSMGVAMVASFLVASVADARLSGDASLTYSSYDGSARSVDGTSRNRMSSSSLVQNYSILYSSDGPIYNSRVGRYDISLGYNWSALDTTFKSSTQPNENYNETRGHLLYNGEINLDPKEVPFKLNAYSRDLTRNSFTSSSGQNSQNFGSILGNRDQMVGINDGLHIESGATLVAGVKNGMTNGYNEILRHFPMILIDYKDTINRDLRSTNPVDDHLSRLAFVSLNKKDNWFHYRHTLYEDHINSSNNYVENEIQLGTVDQYMARRWIDFTNWMKVSTDLMLSRRKSNFMVNSIEDITLNLFATAERKYWNARTFTTFERYMDEYSKLSYQTTLPLYLSGVASQDLSWNARTSYRSNHDSDVLGVTSSFTNVLAGYRVDAFKRASFTLSQSFDVESSQAKDSDLVMLSGGLETTSTSHFSRNVTLGASYFVKNSTTSATGSTSDFLEQRINMNGTYVPSNTLRFEARQNTTFTKGNLVGFGSSTRNAETLLGQYVDPRSLASAEIGSHSFHSLTSLVASWNPKPRLNASLTLNEDVYKSAVVGVRPVTEVLSVVSYSNDAWNVNDTFQYTHGNRELLDNDANSISNSASLRYTHSRNLDTSISASYAATSSKGESSFATEFGQQTNYSYFTKSGIARKLLEFNETLMYADGTSNSSRGYNKSLTLGVKYYPIRQLTLASGVGYSYTTSIHDYSMLLNASATANFRLLQASLDFVHGIRKSDGARENRFTGNIRKSF